MARTQDILKRFAKNQMKTAPSKTIYLIAAFKLFKAVLLTLTGLAALKLIHQDIATTLTEWAHHIHIDPESRHLHRFFVKALNANPKQLEEVAAGTFFYAALCLTEGAGLLLRQRWAEYVTVVMTALFIPIEIYELVEKASITRVTVLMINIGIVWYLVRRLRQTMATE